jgi:hypothetical protein
VRVDAVAHVLARRYFHQCTPCFLKPEEAAAAAPAVAGDAIPTLPLAARSATELEQGQQQQPPPQPQRSFQEQQDSQQQQPLQQPGPAVQAQPPKAWIQEQQDPSLPQASEWGACGGVNGPGGADAAGARCPGGQACVRYDTYYWQCQPAATPEQRARLAAEARKREIEHTLLQRIAALAFMGRGGGGGKAGGGAAAGGGGGAKPPSLWHAPGEFLSMGTSCGGLNGPNKQDAAAPIPCQPGSSCTRLDA